MMNTTKNNKNDNLIFLIIFIFLGLAFLISKRFETPKLPGIVVPQSNIIVAAGDITCTTEQRTSSECKDQETARLVSQINPDAILIPGDLQYDGATYDQFRNYYDKSWGAFKSRTYPAPGNHEYETQNATGYFDYFGTHAGDRGKGYYAFAFGTWKIFALNSNCAEIGCNPDSEQYKWLEDQLTKTDNLCTIAYWHHPLYSSGEKEVSYMSGIWSILEKYHVDIAINGHDHLYERFAPRAGLRQFTIGTGGRSLYKITDRADKSEFVDNKDFGVLKLTLHDNSYQWEFANIQNEVIDSGEDKCR